MTYYATIINGKIDGKGQCPCSGDDTFSVEITEDVYDNIEQYIWNGSEVVYNPDYDNILLEQKKAEKVELNDTLRDTALLSGVTYQNVLFDSDTDQKVNLLATVNMMSDTDTITWYGMDNQGLLCTKADLMAIGGLITELHSYCWNMNAYIKEQIAGAGTISDLEKVEINYNRQ